MVSLFTGAEPFCFLHSCGVRKRTSGQRRIRGNIISRGLAEAKRINCPKFSPALTILNPVCVSVCHPLSIVFAPTRTLNNFSSALESLLSRRLCFQSRSSVLPFPLFLRSSAQSICLPVHIDRKMKWIDIHGY